MEVLMVWKSLDKTYNKIMTEAKNQSGKVVKAIVDSQTVTKGGSRSAPGPIAEAPTLTPVSKPPTPSKK